MTGFILTGVVIAIIIVAFIMYKNRHRTIANVAEDKANDIKDAVNKATGAAKDAIKDLGKKVDENK